MKNLLFLFLLIPYSVLTAQKDSLIEVSGVYPAFAAFNSYPQHPHPSPECGIGALVPWAGKLWYLSYTSHALYESNDKLFSINENYKRIIHPESVGGTHAGRMIHKESKQLIIGPYFIDNECDIRSVDRKKMPGRLTAVARHLKDPVNKVLFLTQEGALYEVDVHTLEPILLFIKPTAGWHAKGAYVSQGVFVMSNNGEEPAPSTFWDVDYSDIFQTRQEISRRYLKTNNPSGPEDMGVLAEWDGQDWKVIERKQYCEVTGPGGIYGAENEDEVIWATGWDKVSNILSVRYKEKWYNYRFMKPSYTLEGMNGSYTEWPRIREIAPYKHMAFMNGGLYDFPFNFNPSSTTGFKPICSLLRTVTDFCSWDGKLVLSSQETSNHGIIKTVPGQPNSNLIFTFYEDLSTKGPAVGWGGVWIEDYVEKNAYSDPLLIEGYLHRTVHFYQTGAPETTVSMEIDVKGNGKWKLTNELNLPAGEYKTIILPRSMQGPWIRFKCSDNVKATVYMHAYSNRKHHKNEKEIFEGIQTILDQDNPTISIVRTGFHTRNLQYLKISSGGDTTYYEVDEQLEFHEKSSPEIVGSLLKSHAVDHEYMEDDASIILKRIDGKIYRMPKGEKAFSRNKNQRGIREVIQERFLANFHGTFYEVPRMGSGKTKSPRNQPDYARMKPVASHNLDIEDYTTWRGLLVIAGISEDAKQNGHLFRSSDQKSGLWFGEVDDLWKLGKPTGTGGPWKDTETLSYSPSDPYLMTGYDKKTLYLSHNLKESVKFIIEIDFTADDSFYHYKTIEVAAGENLVYSFPDGFSAHWIRFLTNKDCRASAILTYE